MTLTSLNAGQTHLDLRQFAGPGNSVKQLAAIRVFKRDRQMGLCQEHLHTNDSAHQDCNENKAVGLS